MKLAIEIDDESVDEIAVAALQRTLKVVQAAGLDNLFPDKEIIAKACTQLIAYYTTNEPLSE